MATRGIRGQSVANRMSAVALFGGFDDHIVRADLRTGRITKIVTAGRTVLFPWDGSHFVCLENALGRPSRERLTLRPFSEPSEIVAADGEWSTNRRLIPGHYPTVLALEGGRLDAIEVLPRDDSYATVGFVPGVYEMDVPVVVDGAWSDESGAAITGQGVGWSKQIYFATSDALVVVNEGRVTSPQVGLAWQPGPIEHDPEAGMVMVASWNRWASLGGPSTDIYVFDEAGARVGTAHVKALVARMAFGELGVMVMDVTDQPHFVELSADAG